MSQPALQLACADLGRQDGVSLTVVSDATLEAQRLAELAGAFALFGLRITLEQADEDAWLKTADEGYRADWDPDSEPANDAEAAPTTSGFPHLPQRGLHIDPRRTMQLVRALDWLFLALAAEFAARWGAGVGLGELSLGHAGAYVFSAGALKIGLWLTESYRQSPSKPERGVGGLALGAILGIVLANLLAPDARGAAALAATLPLTAMVLAGVHAALAVWVGAAGRAGVFAETVVLVGATDAARRFALRAAKTGEARILAVVDDRVSRAPEARIDAPMGGTLEDLLAWDGLPHVDRIVVTVTQKAEARVRQIIERLRVVPNRVDLLLDYQTDTVRGRGVERLTGATVACVSGRPHGGRRAIVKRAQDLVLGGALLALFALPMCVIALAVRCDSKGPALYRQRRHGFNGRVITILKFRTMRHEPGAPLTQVSADDPRITRIGAFLRRTSLDELPQLLNVLRGEMSLVGPRPHAVGMRAAKRELPHIIAEYAHRHRVKPGITGWAQVNGSRGPIETPALVRRRVRLDLDYVARASLWLDLQILLRTAPVLLGDSKATR
jgi:exopolysaccharide biosynthesis polyprenyl glycosylphosphotransferase